MITHHCIQCGQGFYGYTEASKFCSPFCYDNYRHERTKEFKARTKICEICGIEFGPNARSKADFEKRRFCGKVCAGKQHRNTIDNVLKKIVVNQKTGCHIWVGTTMHNGYGQVRLDNRWTSPHRAVWEHFKGPIPEGLQIDHKCKVRNCCNVDHLQVVTNRMNMLNSDNMGAVNLRKPFCPTCGGEYTVKKDGYRYCKPCFNRRSAEYLRKKRKQGITYERTTTHCPKCGEPWHVTPKGQKYCQACRTRNRRVKRELNSQPVCLICGGAYSVWPNGRKYCPPCNKRRQHETAMRYKAKQKLDSQ